MNNSLIYLGFILIACGPLPPAPEVPEAKGDAAYRGKVENGATTPGPQDMAAEAKKIPSPEPVIAQNPAPTKSEPEKSEGDIPPDSAALTGFDISEFKSSCAFGSSPVEVLCVLKDAQDIPVEGVAKAFIFKSSAEGSKEISFRPVDGKAGNYMVTIPADQKAGFGVILALEDNRAGIDWFNASEANELNLVQDGSFEQTNVTGGLRFVPQAESPVWRFEILRAGGCAKPEALLEYASVDDTTILPPSNGRQYVELDTSCAQNVPEGSNVRLYQDITVTENHNYLFRFNLAKRKEAKSAENVQIKIADKIVFDGPVDFAAFKTFSFNRKLTKKQIRIEFLQLGEPEGFGALLDDVRLIDLGPAQ